MLQIFKHHQQNFYISSSEYQCDPTPNGLSDNCIGCICEASTRCNATTKCISGGSFCGPFLLSKPFWVDGGSCVLEGDSPGDQGAWRRCALDIICSANTIRSYINRFGKDCNGDALVTCEDYTMIHKVCSSPSLSHGEPLDGLLEEYLFPDCLTMLPNSYLSQE